MRPEFRHLLVPLDGSRLAEAVLPFALGLAGRLGATVTLLHLLERKAPEKVHGESHLTSAPQARAYLEQIAARCRAAAVEARVHVHAPPVRGVAAGIAEHAAELGADLIAITTHGSGGLRDLIVGSIAQQTLARGTTSILLVRPTATGAAPPFACRTLVVALDPARHGMAPLDAACLLARALAAHLHLLTVVPTPGTLPAERRAQATLSPHAAAAVLDLESRDAEAMLREAAASLEAEGLKASTELRRGDPLSEVIQALRERAADLLVVATHGHVGLGGLLAGSFAPRITSQSSVPVLLVRIT